MPGLGGFFFRNLDAAITVVEAGAELVGDHIQHSVYWRGPNLLPLNI